MGNIYQEIRIAKATFDPSANSGQRSIADHGLGVFIPDNAIVLDAFYDVVTVFASTAGGTDLSVIGLEVQGSDDIVGALAIANALNLWDAGLHKTLVGSPTLTGFHATNNPTALQYHTHLTGTPAVTMIKTTAAREITATVATQIVATGKLNLYVIYFVSE